jgi:hypothetical protein
MVDADNELEHIDCIYCGIRFHFLKRIVLKRRETGDAMFCPNGHAMVFIKSQSEIETLRAEVEKLRASLRVAVDDAVKQKKRADDLALELEIWKPESAVKGGVA